MESHEEVKLQTRPPVPVYDTLETRKQRSPPSNLRRPLPLPPASPIKDEKIVRHSMLNKSPAPVLTPKLPDLRTLIANDQWNPERYDILPDELSVLELVQRYQDLFPLRVFVSRGFYGSNESFTLSEGDVYNIHFIKKTNVVTVKDCGQVKRRIAFNSSVQFGMLYNPQGNLQKAQDGYKYPKVSDIMAISPLPKAVRVTVTFKGTAPSNSIEKNELLIIKGIGQKGNRRHLMVYSLTASKIKHLFESCEGHFSTKPYDVRLLLPDILEHVPQPFPMACYLFTNSETSQQLPHYLTLSVTTLLGESVDTSLIASGSDTDSGQPCVFEIPIDLDIEVQVMQPKDGTDTESLCEQTYNLMENFDDSNVVHCDNVIVMQPGGLGVELVKSQTMKHWLDAHRKDPTRYSKFLPNQHAFSSSLDLARSKDRLCCSTEMLYEKVISLPNPTRITPTHMPSDTNQDKQSHELVSIRADMRRLDNKFTKELASLKEQVDKLSQIVNNSLQSIVVDNTRDKCLNDTSVVPTLQKSQSSSVETYADSIERKSNIEFLHTLDTDNMIKLLDIMGLKQYCQTIAQKPITGDVLLKCSEAALEKELCIESRLHRVRLMKLIDGSQSARGILSGDGDEDYV